MSAPLSISKVASQERYIISALGKQGFLSIKFQLSLIAIEVAFIVRFSAILDAPGDNRYRPSEAHGQARRSRKFSRRNSHYREKDYALINQFLKRKWSPEQIMRVFRKHNICKISHETIYRSIWRDKVNGGTLWTHLHQSPKRRRKRYRAYDSHGRQTNKCHISERPKSVESRRYKDHWEIQPPLNIIFSDMFDPYIYCVTKVLSAL